MIVVEGTFCIADLAKAKTHMETMISASRAEPGCIDYAYALDLLDPHLVRVVERWDSQETLARHLASDHLQVWRAAWPKIGITERSLRSYEAEPKSI